MPFDVLKFHAIDGLADELLTYYGIEDVWPVERATDLEGTSLYRFM